MKKGLSLAVISLISLIFAFGSTQMVSVDESLRLFIASFMSYGGLIVLCLYDAIISKPKDVKWVLDQIISLVVAVITAALLFYILG
jgi:hypothetical protein